MLTWRSPFTFFVLHFATSFTKSASDSSASFPGKTGALVLKDKYNKMPQVFGTMFRNLSNYFGSARTEYAIYLTTGFVSMWDSDLSRCNVINASYLSKSVSFSGELMTTFVTGYVHPQYPASRADKRKALLRIHDLVS